MSEYTWNRPRYTYLQKSREKSRQGMMCEKGRLQKPPSVSLIEPWYVYVPFFFFLSKNTRNLNDSGRCHHTSFRIEKERFAKAETLTGRSNRTALHVSLSFGGPE